IRRLARPALLTATGSLVVPFAAGLGLAFLAPTFLEAPPLVPRGAFALLMGTVLAISALPVLARILMDLSLLGSEIGTLCLAAAMLDDVIGWLALSLAIGWSQPGTSSSVALTAAGTLGFAAVVIAARPLLDRVAARAGLAPLLVLALLGGAATHHLGTHAAIGSFLVGIAIRTEHLPEEVRRSVERFVTSFFSPILFAAIGLRVDYAASFSLPLTLLIITIATITKLAGAGGGALVAGYPRRFAFAAAAGLNARGAMGVVLSEVALDRGLIGRPLFVALVSMALVTSLASGPLLARFARR
ncbi:MAG TPA: cation:proton antiporter, partial [Planctomycetota bacterium]|nr:cation:proton antiporter [Planctomycetota bacterium]